MSQKVRIHSVRVEGHVYIDDDTWTQSSNEVMRWLSDGWRGCFNNFRQRREWTGCKHEATEPLTQSQFKASTEYRKALPTSVLQSMDRFETKDWIASLRRIKTTKSGRPSRFKRRHDGLYFRVLGSGYSEVRRLSKHRGELTVTGKNPSGRYGPGDRLNWKVRIRFRWSQEIRDYTSVMVNWSRGTMSFVNSPLPIEREHTGSMIGIDVGVTHTLATSNDEFIDIPRPTKSENARHTQLQRKMARQDRVNEERGGKRAKFGSQRRARTLAQMNRLSSKQARRRRDWVEGVTTRLVKDHDQITLEDLSPKRMTARGGRYKRGLNRGILESCWGLFQSRLMQKAGPAGVQVVWINPAYTSQTCNQCGHIARENRESQAVFTCRECGHIANADINAANNILDIGLGQSLGRGGSVRQDEMHASSSAVPAEPSTSMVGVA